MSLLFIDGFDHYTTADLFKKWTSGSGTIVSNGGRRGGGALTVANAGSQTVSKSLGASKGTLIIGAALSYSGLPGTSYYLLRFRDGTTTQFCLDINNAGKLRAVNGAGTVIATSTQSLATGFHYVEFKVTFGNSGFYELRVDNVQWLTGSTDTTSSANNSADGILLGDASGSGVTISYDDLYVCDTAGSLNIDFLGDVRVDTLYPTSDGANTAWTPSTGPTHYTLVDETTPNTTDYVESGTATQKDTYGFGDISHTPVSVFGAQISIAALKDDAGARSIKAVTRSGGTDYSGTEKSLGTSLVYYYEIRETDPATSAAWTKTNLNAAEFGVECV